MPKSQLNFEGGKLVKVDGARPEYMSGHRLICLTRELAERLQITEYHLSEVCGTVDEYLATPCKSLRDRMRGAVDKARAALT